MKNTNQSKNFKLGAKIQTSKTLAGAPLTEQSNCVAFNFQYVYLPTGKAKQSGITCTGRGTTLFRPQVHLSYFIKMKKKKKKHKPTCYNITCQTQVKKTKIQTVKNAQQ